MAARGIEKEMKRARRGWKADLEMGNTTEPFKSWSQANAPALQAAMQYGDAERAMYEQEQFRERPHDDRFAGGLQRPRIESESDRERHDQRFRDIQGKVSSGFPQGEEQIKEMQNFIKDQVARVSDEEKRDRGGENGSWTKLDRLYQRMILKPDERKDFNVRKRREGAKDEDFMKMEDLSEDELRECVSLLWDLVP